MLHVLAVMNGILLMHNYFAFIQARTNSTRFQGKVLEKIGDKNLIEHIYFRLEKILFKENIILLIPENDSKLIDFANSKNYKFFKGSENDVRSRFIAAAEKFNAENIIRLTADNPFIDYNYIEYLLSFFKYKDFDISSFSGLPLGMGVEIFKISSIIKSPKNGLNDSHFEHVSLHLKETDEFKFLKLFPFISKTEVDITSNIRLSIDKPVDLEVCRDVHKQLGDDFNLEEVIKLYKQSPEIFKKNNTVEQIKFTTKSIKTKKNIFINFADPLPNGRGHYERCKYLSTILQLNNYHVQMDSVLDEENEYDLYIIDSRDKLVPDSIRNKKIILIDNFGSDRYSNIHFDTLPNMLNDFEESIQNTLIPQHFFEKKDPIITNKVFCYAGNLSFRESYKLDLFLCKQFQSSNYEIIRVGGSHRKKKNLSIKIYSKLNKTEYLRFLNESEFFISYFGQSIMEATYLEKKIILFSISDYHDELAFHFVQNSNAMYAGDIRKQSLIYNANFLKFTRPNVLGMKGHGYEKLIKLIEE